MSDSARGSTQALLMHHSGVTWCITNLEQAMATRPKTRKKRGGESGTARASVSFPAELYEALERIATQKKVSVAWVVREAAAQYVVDKSPLQRRY